MVGPRWALRWRNAIEEVRMENLQLRVRTHAGLIEADYRFAR